MNQRQIALFLAFYFYLLNMAAANEAQRVLLFFCIKQLTSTSGANFDAEIAALLRRHYTDGYLEQLSCSVPLLLIVTIIRDVTPKEKI